MDPRPITPCINVLSHVPSPGFEFTDDRSEITVKLTYHVELKPSSIMTRDELVAQMRELAHAHASQRINVRLDIHEITHSVLANDEPF